MSLKLIRAGQEALNKVAPNIPTPITNAANYVLNPMREPQRSYMWEVRFFSPLGNGEDVKYYAKTVGIPTTLIESIRRSYQGVTYAYSGKDNSPHIFRATFWDNQDLLVYKYFDEWINRIKSADNHYKATPENYLRQIEVHLMDSSDFLTTQQVVLHNCFPTEISEIALTYNESAEVTFDVMFFFGKKELVRGKGIF